MSRPPGLRRLQRWLCHVIRHPATADVAVRSKAARALFPLATVSAGRVVRPNDRMSATDRLQVYNGGYLARLLEVLAGDYPGLQQLLGAERFHALCAAYVDRHPSRHPNLNQLGRNLPAFVARQRSLPHRAFAAELARLELGITKAFDAPEFEPMPAERLGAIATDLWPRARLVCNPSLQLFSFAYPVDAWFSAFRSGATPRPPRRRASHLAVFRLDDGVQRLQLAPAAHAVLAALAAGRPLAVALVRAQGGAAVAGWFRTWSAAGLFTAARIGR